MSLKPADAGKIEIFVNNIHDSTRKYRNSYARTYLASKEIIFMKHSH